MSTVRDSIEKSVAKNPQKTFLFFPETTSKISYLELLEDIKIIGAGLKSLGLEKSDKVGFLLENGIASVELFLGAMYNGFVIAPLNIIAAESQWEYIIEHSEMKLLFFSPKYKKFVTELIAKEPFKYYLHTLEQDKNQSPCRQFISKNTINERVDLSPNDEALLMYTSGTTGKPKGVILSQQNVVAGGENVVLAHQLEETDKSLCVLPLYHINAQMVSIMAPLISQSSVVLPNSFSVSKFWDLLVEYSCSWFSLVPTNISYLLNSASEPNKKLDFVKFGRSASSPLPPVLHHKFETRFGVSIIETMGITEAAAQILSNPRDPKKRKYNSPGIEFGNKIQIIKENFELAKPNEEGEIVVKGKNVMKCYFKNEIETKQTLVDGWLKTGDLGKMDHDGFVFVTGRLKELIIKGGENISPKEIDEVLYSLEGVIEAAAFGIPDDNYGQEIAAALVMKNKKYSKEQILEYCSKKLNQFKTPKDIYFFESLPKGPSGKIQRNKVAAKFN